MPPRLNLAYLFFAITLCVLLLWLFSHRYIVTTASDGLVYKTNRYTGETFVLSHGDEFRSVSKRTKQPSLYRDVTASELKSLVGSCRFYSDHLSLTVYNGNKNVVITDVSIALHDGKKILRYSYEVSIPPLSTKDFDVSTLPLPPSYACKWWIDSARCRPGHK